MKPKYVIYTIIILGVLFTLLACSNGFFKKECEPQYCMTSLGILGINDCIDGEKTGCVLQVQLSSCHTRDGKLTKICRYDNSGLKIGVNPDNLRANEFIILDVNLQKAVLDSGLEIEDYFVCYKTDIKESDEIYVPPVYYASEKFNGLSCSLKLNVNDYHHLVLYGILDKTGKVNLAEVYLFEEEFGTTQEFYENLDKSTAIFSLEVDI